MDSYKRGQWNVICDRCGFKYKSGNLRKEWTGLMVCSGAETNNCWDARHPQETIKAKADRQAVPWTRPDSEGRDVSPGSGNEVSEDDL